MQHNNNAPFNQSSSSLHQIYKLHAIKILNAEC